MEIQIFMTLSLGILGLLFGSFANVCVHRIPLGESIVSPPSHCPKCGTHIRWYDNIPLLSWLLLQAKCRYCNATISWRYPFLELSMGLIWAGIASVYVAQPMLLAQAIIMVSMLWILTLIDIETFLLPNAITLPGIGIGLLFSWHFGYGVDAIIGAAAGYGFFWAVAKAFYFITGKEGIGQGDFKLLAMLGAFMGWQALPFVVLLSSVTGAILGSVVLILQNKGIRQEIPYGPYLALAGVIWFFFDAPILDWYQLHFLR